MLPLLLLLVVMRLPRVVLAHVVLCLARVMVTPPCVVVLRVALMLLLALRLPLRTLALLLRGVFCIQQVLMREAPEKVFSRLLLLLLLVVLLLLMRIVQLPSRVMALRCVVLVTVLSPRVRLMLLPLLLLLQQLQLLCRVIVPHCVVLSPRFRVVVLLAVLLLQAPVLLLLPLAAAARTGPVPRGCAQRAPLARGQLRCASAAKAAGVRC